ncbi:class I SAM-dependent methyltransferase [Anaerovoracaceae bacterium 42-11]
MKPENIEKINHSFEIQAPNFESKSVNSTKEEYLNYTISCVAPCKENTLLEVAAGTCACGRSFAPLVQTVVCLDATVPMLQIGQQEADKEHLSNMVFVKGYAEELPFLDNSFDIVFSRLAFHHFTDVTAAFSEMVRVLKPGGKLVMIDMEAADEPLRKTEDEIETLRDPSHVKNLSKAEMLSLFETHGLAVEKSETTEMPQRLENWLALTQTPAAIREKIRQRMQADITGHDKTGFSPYLKNNDIFFNHKWVLTIGRKGI